MQALTPAADDYVTKPFDTDELLARIRAALRRGPQADEDPRTSRIDDLEIDMELRLVRLDGEVVHLAAEELELLEVLVAHPGQLLTQEFLLRTVWGPETARRATTCASTSGSCARARRRRGPAPAHPHRTRRRLPLDRKRGQRYPVTSAGSPLSCTSTRYATRRAGCRRDR